MKELYSSLRALCVFALTSLVLVSCGGGSNFAAEDVLPMNADGRMLEEFAPEGSNFVFSYSMQDSDQRALMDSFAERFSFADEGSLYDDMLAEIFPDYDLSFEENIKPMFGENYRVLVAGDVDFSEDPKNPNGVIELYGDEEDASMVIALTLDDADKAYDLLEAFATREEWIKGNFEGFPVLANANSGTQMMIVDSFLVLASDQLGLSDSLDRYNANMLSLADNQDYVDAVAFFEDPQMAYVYINMSGESVGASVTALGFQSGVDFYQIYGARAEDDGFALSGVARFDEDMLKDMSVNFKEFKGKGAYMADRLTNAGSLLMYSESYNIAEGLASGPLLEDPSLSNGFEAFFGSTLEEGLLSWFDQGFVMAMYGSDALIPGVTFAVDANSNLEAAKEFYFKLDGQLSGVVAMAQTEGLGLEKRSEGEMTIVSLDLTTLKELGVLPESLYTGKLELSYGLTEEGYFVLSLADGFYDLYMTQSLGNPSYDDAVKTLGSTDGGVTYIGFNAMIQYLSVVSNFVSEMYQAQADSIDISVIDGAVEGVSGDDFNPYLQAQVEFKTNMDKIIDFLDEFEYLVLGNTIKSSNEVQSQGYLKLR